MFENRPTPDTSKLLKDELLFQRATETYLWLYQPSPQTVSQPLAMASAWKPKIPLPPRPRKRREPLSSSLPGDNRDAEAHVKAILDSPSYRIASENPDFLASDAARGLRLQMD
jgi:hypothetical protein